MKRFLVGLCAVVLLSWVCSSNPVWADSTDPRTFVLSNERGSAYGGGLIDMLIAAGHGSKNLYQILQLLCDQPGTGIPTDFVASVGNNPGGSEVFTAVLSYFAGLNGPVCINADGTLRINPIFGRDYDGQTGYVTNKVNYPGIALANFIMAESPTYYIDAGETIGTLFPNYLAIGIAWADTAGPEPIPTLNEWGMILMGLILAGIAAVSMRRRRAVGQRL